MEDVLLMGKPKKGVFRARSGQARLTESILAVGLILIIFSVSIYLMSASKVWTIYEKGDLDKLGYNLLSYLLEARAIDNLEPLSTQAEEEIRFLVERHLPPMTFFNLTIYNCTINVEYSTEVHMDPLLKVNNSVSEAFEKSVEVSSTSALYTSRKGSVYFIILTLSRSGEAIKKEG